MQSAFDTRTARFDPEQASAMSGAYQLALKRFPADMRVPSSTKSKLAKIIVNLALERMRQHRELNAEEICCKATACVSQLRPMALAQ